MILSALHPWRSPRFRIGSSPDDSATEPIRFGSCSPSSSSHFAMSVRLRHWFLPIGNRTPQPKIKVTRMVLPTVIAQIQVRR
jgi:hypothetical protein